MSVSFRVYEPSDRQVLLELLLELHDAYFQKHVPRAIKELYQEVDIHKAMSIMLTPLKLFWMAHGGHIWR